MDNKEAIRVIESMKTQYTHALEYGRVPQLHKGLYEKYIKSYDLAIQALEKQIPKKPIIEEWSPTYCPSCNAELSEGVGDGYYQHFTSLNICDCGQKLDWD